MSSEEISHLRGSPSQADKMDLAPEDADTARKTSGKSANSKNERPHSREADSMDIDDFDDY